MLAYRSVRSRAVSSSEIRCSISRCNFVNRQQRCISTTQSKYLHNQRFNLRITASNISNLKWYSFGVRYVSPLFRRHFSDKTLPSHTKILLPKLSPTMETGNITEWKKEEGEYVDEGSVIALVETDKAEMEMETPEAGYLAKIIVEAGSSDVPMNKLIGILVEEESEIAAFKDFVEDASSSPPATDAQPPAQTLDIGKPVTMESPPPKQVSQQTSTAAQPASQGRVVASPLAKQLAASKGVDIQSITGSGPGGRVVASDIESAASSPAPSSSTPSSSPSSIPSGAQGAFTDMTLSGMRKTIAKRLVESKQTIPHYYLSVDVEMDNIMALRKELNANGGEDFKLSVNDFIIKASSLALQNVPECNSSWMGDFIRQYHNVDISIAVSTDGGLITPIIFRADQKGLTSINKDVKSLAEKARNKQLQPHEFQGGTFSISNLGMFGVKSFSAVINPPQSCILAVGATENMLVPDSSDERGFRAASMMSVTLSCDHRVVDGAVGATWLKHFKSYLEKPMTMLL